LALSVEQAGDGAWVADPPHRLAEQRRDDSADIGARPAAVGAIESVTTMDLRLELDRSTALPDSTPWVQ
jgi:hypothetical protein